MQFDEHLRSLTVKARHLGDIIKDKVEKNLIVIDRLVKKIEKKLAVEGVDLAQKVGNLGIKPAGAVENPLKPINNGIVDKLPGDDGPAHMVKLPQTEASENMEGHLKKKISKSYL